MTEDNTDLIDADDYHRKQRLKEIHQTRQAVADSIQTMEIDKNDPRPYTAEMKRVAHNIGLYIQELIPIIEGANLDDDMAELPDEYKFDNLFEFARTLGMVPGTGKAPTLGEMMAVYEQGNRILATVRPLIDNSDGEAAFDYEDIEG